MENNIEVSDANQTSTEDNEFDLDIRLSTEDVSTPLGYSGCACTGTGSGTHNCC